MENENITDTKIQDWAERNKYIPLENKNITDIKSFCLHKLDILGGCEKLTAEEAKKGNHFLAIVEYYEKQDLPLITT